MRLFRRSDFFEILPPITCFNLILRYNKINKENTPPFKKSGKMKDLPKKTYAGIISGVGLWLYLNYFIQAVNDIIIIFQGGVVQKPLIVFPPIKAEPSYLFLLIPCVIIGLAAFLHSNARIRTILGVLIAITMSSLVFWLLVYMIMMIGLGILESPLKKPNNWAAHYVSLISPFVLVIFSVIISILALAFPGKKLIRKRPVKEENDFGEARLRSYFGLFMMGTLLYSMLIIRGYLPYWLGLPLGPLLLFGLPLFWILEQERKRKVKEYNEKRRTDDQLNHPIDDAAKM